MTAETDLLPSSVAAFTEALKGGRGSLDAWLEVNEEREVAAHVEAYARACVSSATEALRAEVVGLRSLLVPGLRVYEGDHVMQVAIGPRLFTSRYIDADDKPRALRHAIATACAALDQETTNG